MPEPSWNIIAKAVVRAEIAVAADVNGDLSTAITAYKEVIDLLSSADISTLTPAQQNKIHQKCQMYSERLHTLETPRGSTTVEEPVLFTLDFLFDSIPKGSSPDPPPASPFHRPYWLMRVLYKTMTTGGYLTPKLYVPRQIWFQTGIKLTGVSSKFMSCDTALIYLLKMEKENVKDRGSWNKLDKDLDEICGILGKIQNNLSRKLPFIAEVELTLEKEKQHGIVAKGIGSMVKSVSRAKHTILKEKIADDTKYIDTLVRLFEKAQFLEDWLNFFESIDKDVTVDSILVKLRKLGDFLYSVVCAFVIRDFDILIQRYMKKIRLSFVEFE